MASGRDLMFGVFLPLANGGWIISENTPKVDGSYRQNREAAVLADQLGFDFILSMMKWRGYGGKTNHWGVSLESMTMMAALAEATSAANASGMLKIASVAALLRGSLVPKGTPDEAEKYFRFAIAMATALSRTIRMICCTVGHENPNARLRMMI